MTKKLIPQTEEWGNIELPGLSDEELYNKNWESIARARARNENPQYRNLLNKGLEQRSKSLWKENNKKANQITWKLPKNIESRKNGQRLKNGYPVFVIDIQNNRYEFGSVAECAEYFKAGVLGTGCAKYFNKTGEIYIGQRRQFKGWKFGRIV
jgi:hypothetical protein